MRVKEGRCFWRKPPSSLCSKRISLPPPRGFSPSHDPLQTPREGAKERERPKEPRVLPKLTSESGGPWSESQKEVHLQSPWSCNKKERKDY